MDESPEDEVVRDRIDPVTGVKTGEDAQASGEPEVVDEDVVGRALNLARTGVELSVMFYIGFTTLVGVMAFLFLRDFGISSESSLVSQIIPTMFQSWIALAFTIILVLGVRKLFGFLYTLIEPIIVPGNAQNKQKEEFSFEKMAKGWYESFQTTWLAAPNNISMAVKSAWRGRERGLAIFAGVFLSSLVITTVLAYAVGLNQSFFAFSLDNDVFDAKVDFQEDPDNWYGRTNNSTHWELMCDQLTEMEEFSDCGLVFGRQGVRVSGFFDSGFVTPQPLNVEGMSGSTSDWGNVSWDYEEARENGPEINSKRIIRFYGDGVWDGELGERHAKDVIFGSWPASAADAEANRSIVLPSRIASAAGVEVNDTIDSLTFSYVIGTYLGEDIPEGYQSCTTITDVYFDDFVRMFCKDTMNVTDLKVAAIYEEGDFGNPSLLFHPVIVTDSVLSEEQKTTLMDSDHAYLGVAVDRAAIPTSSTRAASDWLSDLKDDLEKVERDVTLVDPVTNESFVAEGVNVGRLFTVGCSDPCGIPEGTIADVESGKVVWAEGSDVSLIAIEYNDLISGTITFLNIFLGIIQTFDYILVIPIVALSFVVLIYGLVLSLEQRRREVAIHRVIGGTEATLTRMMVLEIYAIGTIAWALGFGLASGAVEIVLRSVGFLRFTDEGEFKVDPVLSFGSTFVVTALTVGIAYYYGKKRTSDFLSIEIDEGVRRISNEKEPNYLLHWVIFSLGLLAFVESWIESRGGLLSWGSGGIVTSFIPNAVLLLLGPFFLWIGGALVLSRVGAAGPQILNRLVGWSPAISDIRRGLSGSGSSSSVSRLSLIMMLTLSIVTLAAVQGHTGTLVDQRTTDAQNGADLKVQFDSTYSEAEASNLIMQSIQTVGDNDVSGISSMTSVGNIITSTKEDGVLLPTWVVFDGHEDTLLWDTQSIPGDDINKIANKWSTGNYTAGEGAKDSLDDPLRGSTIVLQYTTYAENEFGLPEVTGVRETAVKYAGTQDWIPGLSATEVDPAIVIGERTYIELVGSTASQDYKSTTWLFELCDQEEEGCADALETISANLRSVSGVVSAQDWSSAHESNERNGGLIFGTPGLLSMMFVVAALASVSSAFVFLSLVLSQRKRELAILQAIGASPNQVVRLVLFEIMSILLVSMVLGVTLGLAVSESFNGFFGVFGFIFQLFLGQSAPIDRDLVWPWLELVAVNGLVLGAVVLSLLFTTRRALDADLATVLKGE